MEELAQIRSMTNALIAIDATSWFGGVVFDWMLGDVWFASVQKCLGLPAGMGIMVCSPKALEKARKVNDILRYNSLLFMHKTLKNTKRIIRPIRLAFIC